MPVNAIESRETFEDWFAEALERTSAGIEQAFAVLSADTGDPIGSTRYLALRPEHRGLEIGWTWLAPAAWSTGANAEAKLMLIRHAFEELACMRVEFKTDASNVRSRAALEALPARFEGIFRKHMLVRDGAVRDSAWYAVTDEEWPAVEANLLERITQSR
jgi:N-acetyltransferase